MLNSITGAGLISSRPLTVEEMRNVTKIRVLRGCGANGQSLEAGRIYSVPDEVSAENANILILMNLAKEIQEQEEKVIQETQEEKKETIQEIQEEKKQEPIEMVQEIQEEKNKKSKRGGPKRRK